MTKDKILNRLYFVALPLLLLVAVPTLIYSAKSSHESHQANIKLATVNMQLKDQVQSSENIVKEQDRHLQCILAFFGATDRANSRISSFEPCTIIHNTTGQSEILPLLPAGTPSQLTPAEQTEAESQAKSSVTPDPTPTPATPTPVVAQPAVTLPNCTVDVLFIHIGC